MPTLALVIDNEPTEDTEFAECDDGDGGGDGGDNNIESAVTMGMQPLISVPVAAPQRAPDLGAAGGS